MIAALGPASKYKDGLSGGGPSFLLLISLSTARPRRHEEGSEETNYQERDEAHS